MDVLDMHASNAGLKEAFAGAEVECKPLVIRGLASDWPACNKWEGEGGLRHLDAKAGQEEVQVMCSPNEIFYGDLEHHQPVTLRFTDFLNKDTGLGAHSDVVRTYLAQAPIDKGPMAVLHDDISMPDVLQGKEIEHMNLWMTLRFSRSGFHYDPYHNILCVVSGKKDVKLCSPKFTPNFYPFPVESDSANHSAVNFVNPDFQNHPEYRDALRHQSTVSLKAGDALFIPEGWWHQVDSAGGTIGVNFWWQSQMHKLLAGHMAPYFLRELARSEVKQEVDLIMCQVDPLNENELDADISSSYSSGSESDESDSSSERTELNPNPVGNDLGGFEEQELPRDPEAAPELESNEHRHTGYEFSQLDSVEQQGLTWLASFLCSKAQMHHEGNETFVDNSSTYLLVKWLQTYPPFNICRILYIFSSAFPALMGLFWEVIPPLGVYMLTNSFETLEKTTGFGTAGVPPKEEIFSKIYREWEAMAQETIKEGRKKVLKHALTSAMMRHNLCVSSNKECTLWDP